MATRLKVRYVDRGGGEDTTILNDGVELRMKVRGIEFVGSSFDDFEPTEGSNLAGLGFTLQQGSLGACTLTCVMPLPVVVDGEDREGVLNIHLELGDGDPKGGMDHEVVALRFELAGDAYASSGTSGWFEDELLELQGSLPSGTHLKACITCAFSDYSPAGHGLFGCLACFREVKGAYRRVDGKRALFDLWNQHSGFVQETYLCPEYERRKPGSGYRG